jgi:uncharacterized protein (TIRG00374 family)
MKTALKLIVSVCLIGAIVWNHGGLAGVEEQIRRISFLYIVPVAALNLVDRGLMTYKWSLLLRGRGHKLPFLRGMMIYCASWVWGFFLPTTVGSDAIRAYCTSRMGFDSREVVASIIVERFVGFLTSLVLMILSLALLTSMGSLGGQVMFAWSVGAVFTLAGALLYVVSVSDKAFDLVHNRILVRFRRNRIAARLREFHETYHEFMRERRHFGAFFWLTFLEQMFPILVMWVIARGMGIESGLVYFAGALPLAMLFSRLPISFDGIGVFEAVFVLLISLAGVSASQAVAISLTGRLIMLLVLIPWWLAFVIVSGNIHVPRVLPKESAGQEIAGESMGRRDT